MTTTTQDQFLEQGADAPVDSERRVEHRRSVPPTHQLKLTVGGKSHDAELIDYSNGGLGVRTASPLEWGAIVNISGTVRMVGVWMRISGVAGVIHCEAEEDGLHRVGLRIDVVEWRAAEAPGPA